MRTNNLLVLNGRAERDRVGAATCVWRGDERSVLDLAVVPADVSADLQVTRPWEGAMVHRAITVWVQLGQIEAQTAPTPGAEG